MLRALEIYRYLLLVSVRGGKSRKHEELPRPEGRDSEQLRLGLIIEWKKLMRKLAFNRRATGIGATDANEEIFKYVIEDEACAVPVCDHLLFERAQQKPGHPPRHYTGSAPPPPPPHVPQYALVGLFV